MRVKLAVVLGGCVLVASSATIGLAAPSKRAPPRPREGALTVRPVGPVTGPVAEYWISAATTSGFAAGLSAAGQRPSMGAILKMAAGRGPSYARSLTLQLGSTLQAQGSPAADHYVPSALGVGTSVPLVTPPPPRLDRPARAEPEPASPESYQRPRGRLLIYWGCGEHAGAGQPVVFDFAALSAGAPLPELGGAVHVNVERPPTVERSATYGHWPNEKRRIEVPATGSLVGSHDVRGDYSPEIRFDVTPDLDFMPALNLADAGLTPGGGKRLTWSSASSATGYHLMLVGAQGAGPQVARGAPASDGSTMVFWSSSEVKPGLFGAGLTDYVSPVEVARLVRDRAVLPPTVSECVVPSEVVQASPAGLVTAIGYGPEQIWTDPPRPASGPWSISWRAKLRLKTTAILLLGAPLLGHDSLRPRAPSATDLLRSFRPF